MIVEGYGTVDPAEKKRVDRCRKWRLRVSAGFDLKTGKPKRRERRFSGTYTEAVKALEAFAVEVNDSTHHQRAKLTVGQLCDEWLEERAMVGEVAQETLDKNANHVMVIKHQLAGTPARALETRHVTQALSNLMQGDSPSGKPLGGAYCQGVLTTFRMVYSWAVKRGYAAHNPVADAPRPKSDTPEQRALTEQQIRDVTSKLSTQSRTDAAVMLALWGGLRRKEIVTLEWGHVDLIGSTMRVPDTKNAASYAAIPMFPFLEQ